MKELLVYLLVIALCGVLGGFVNVFIGDSGFHLPRFEHGIWRPGWIGVVFIGAMASVTAWLATQSAWFTGSVLSGDPIKLHLSECGTAILIGLGGARWFKSEIETRIFRKTAALAAGKDADKEAASMIAAGTPMEALSAAIHMR